MPRLFIGFKIADQDGHCLINSVKDANLKLDQNIRWTMPGDFHITSHFMPHCTADLIPNIKHAMQEAVQGLARAVISIDKIDLFPQYGSTLCAAYVSSNPLIISIHKRLSISLEKLGVAIETLNYKPHITLARGLAQHDPFKAIAFNAKIKLDSLILYESSAKTIGPRYTPLYIAKLA